MYDDFRSSFPELSANVDESQKKYLNEIALGTPFFWFECLATYINNEMSSEVDPKNYKPVFEYFRSNYLFSGAQVKECIDVSFIENLFHNVNSQKTEPYWVALPDLLKDMYFNFHQNRPS